MKHYEFSNDTLMVSFTLYVPKGVKPPQFDEVVASFARRHGLEPIYQDWGITTLNLCHLHRNYVPGKEIKSCLVRSNCCAAPPAC